MYKFEFYAKKHIFRQTELKTKKLELITQMRSI